MKRSFSMLLRRSSRRLLAGAALLLCAAALSSCQDPDDPVARDNTAMLPESQRVSSVPWNKPEGWESTSQIGSQLANDPRLSSQH